MVDRETEMAETSEVSTPLLNIQRTERDNFVKESFIPTKQKWLFLFPESLERKIEVFDDEVMKVVQRLSGKHWLYIDLFITGIFAIETGIAAPFVLFVLGFDGMATELSYLMLIVSILSQIPKRFLWRYRPYMVNRGNRLRPKETAVTSSFPSRAVTCAVVYSFVVIYAFIFKVHKTFQVEWWMPFLVIFAALLSSFARINMGVHYPSDCVAGFIQGIVVCAIGTILWQLDTLGCSNCINGSCYSDLYSNHSLTKQYFVHRFNWLGLFVILAISSIITALSIIKPINFWAKCDRVYGMLFPGIAFQLTCLCPSMSNSSLPKPSHIPWYAYFYALAFVGTATAVQFKNNGKYPMVVFLLSFIILYTALVLWRVLVMV